MKRGAIFLINAEGTLVTKGGQNVLGDLSLNSPGGLDQVEQRQPNGARTEQ